MASNELLVERDKIQEEILALESSLRADGGNITDLLSLDASSDDESVDSGAALDEVVHDDLEAERQRIQREIEELENTLGVNGELFDIETESEHDSDFSNEDRVELDLPQNIDTCLQINLVYQEVLKEKLSELEKLLRDNKQQQKEIESQLSGPTICSSSSPGGIPIQKLFLGYFMKPYFKDKLTGLGPPANDETKERMSQGIRPVCELKTKRWEVWQKALLTNAVATDTMKRMLKPKLSKLDYLSGKMSKANDEEKEEIKKQIDLIQQDIAEISTMREDQLLGDLNDEHDWEKISNVDFEGLRHAEDLKRFWQNYLHPSINKTIWKQEEIDKLREVVQEYNCCHWDEIAEALGTKRTAFMCFQTYQRYISKTFRRKEWTKEEDQILRELVKKMRVGNFIPYMQMSYFMMGRDGSQLSYRWTSALDPSIKKGPWTKEEDQLLLNAVAKNGAKEWGKIRAEVPGRTDGACRDRYLDCLQENVKKGAWSTEEVELLKQKVEKYGVGKWTKIASEIPNRVDSQCLNKWKQLTQTNQGNSRKRKPVQQVKLTSKVQQKTKRRKVIQKKIKDVEMTSSSEDEKQVKVEYMDSDVEADVPSDEDLPEETPVKDYIQPDIKHWIPLNTKPLVCNEGIVRTIWVSLSTNGDDLMEPNKPTTSGRNRSQNSICPPVKPSPVRTTFLDHFGNVERTYVGIDATVLLNPADNQKTLIKVPVNDVKHLLQWKATSGNKKDKGKSSEDKKKKRRVQNCSSLIPELLKAISPWIGNVILPVEANKKKLCEADIIGTKAAEILLPKTPVFSFFIKALHIDAEGCKNVIKVRQKRRLRIPGSESKPKTVLPNTVLATLQERKCMKNVSQEHAGHVQHPPSLPSVQPQEMTTPASIFPSSIVIAQPNMQEIKQPLLLNGQKISVLPKSPPQAIFLPLIQLAAPVQPVTTLTTTSRSPSISKRVTQRQCKPTQKAQALMEEAKAKSCKKQALKQVWANKSTGLSTVKFQTQPINWIVTPGRSIQVTEILSANFPGNQMLNVPNNSPINASTLPGTLTNLCLNPLTIPCVTDSFISYSPHLKPSSSINITSAGIQTPLTNSSVENKSTHSSALQMSPVIVHQKDLIVHTQSLGPTVSTNNPDVDLPSSSSSEGTVLGHHLSSSSSTLASVSPAATNVFSLVPSPSDLSVPSLVSAPVVSKPQVVYKSICAPTTIQQQSTSLHHVSQSTVPQVGKPSEPSISNPDLPSDTLSFDTNLLFLDHQSEVNDWMNGNGGISLPNLEITLPYLPPSAASIKKLTSLLKAKQSLLSAAAHILPHDYQNGKEEKEQEEAIRKLVAERFATNPAYLWLKARFLSCFTLPALLATINPYKDWELPDSPLRNNDRVVDKHAGENNEPPAARTDLNTNENEALETQFSGICTNRQCP